MEFILRILAVAVCNRASMLAAEAVISAVRGILASVSKRKGEGEKADE